jgi:hypothetical protein
MSHVAPGCCDPVGPGRRYTRKVCCPGGRGKRLRGVRGKRRPGNVDVCLMRTMGPDREISVELTDGDSDHRIRSAQCRAESGCVQESSKQARKRRLVQARESRLPWCKLGCRQAFSTAPSLATLRMRGLVWANRRKAGSGWKAARTCFPHLALSAPGYCRARQLGVRLCRCLQDCKPPPCAYRPFAFRCTTYRLTKPLSLALSPHRHLRIQDITR